MDPRHGLKSWPAGPITGGFGGNRTCMLADGSLSNSSFEPCADLSTNSW